MKKEVLSIPVLGIRLVRDKTFGFARLADRGGDAFVPPPLMRGVEKTPPHAIVELEEKGRRVARFLDEPEVRFVWEGKRDEARMIALVPELARQWADRKEAELRFIWSVQDTGNKEFQSLWSAAVGAGEADAGKFLSRWEKEFFVPARKREVNTRLPSLFEAWRATLPQKAETVASKAYEYARKGQVFDDEDAGRYLSVPWWNDYTSAEMQVRVEALHQNHLALVREARVCGREESNLRAREQMREREIWQAAEQHRQLAGVYQGLLLAGIADLVEPREVLKGWDRAGNYFPTPDATTGELHALRWYRERREAEVRHIFAAACDEAKVEYQKVWYEEASYDPEYYCRHDDSDNLYCGSSTGEYVGGGSRSKDFPWFIEAVVRIQAIDKAAGFRADLSALVAGELRLQMETLDTESLSRWAWAAEDKIFLPQNKTKHARKRIAVWLRECRKHGAQMFREWRQPPQGISNSELSAKAQALFVKIKVRELRLVGLREEEAKVAARSASEERKFRDVVSVRKDWETMLRWRSASGGYRGLHPEAQALLEEMRGKQGELREQSRLSEQLRAEEEAREKQAEKEGFLGAKAGVWGALNGLKLK
ncbi:MAG: hypothetical protein Q7R54_01190 [bacterium]|nr:hypothetical protein [bacterium]